MYHSLPLHPPTPPSFFLTCGGSYLRRPRRWIIPLTTNPFATVEGMRAPVGSPPGPAGASSSSPSSGLPGSLQAATPAPPSHSLIHIVLSVSPGRTPAATGTEAQDDDSCLYFGSVFLSLALARTCWKELESKRSRRDFVPRQGASRPDARDTVSIITRAFSACARDGCRFDTEKHSHARPADVHKYCGCSLATEPPTQSVRNTSEAPRGPSPFTRAGARLQNVPRTRVHDGCAGTNKAEALVCNRLLDF